MHRLLEMLQMAMIDRPVKINGTKYSIKDIEILTG
mgnify:CR=1 FL=1